MALTPHFPQAAQPIQRLERQARGILRQGAPWIAALARVGFAAKGTVYILIGAIAANAAFGARRVQDEKGVLRELTYQPFGKVLVGLIVVGLAGYAFFRAVQALLNPEGEAEKNIKGVGLRIGWGVTAITHVALLVFAASLLTGDDSGGGRGEARALSARIMSWDPVGAWLVGAAGVALAGIGIGQLYHAAVAMLDKRLDLSPLSHGARTFVVTFSRFGLAARGLVFLMTGAFVVHAAWTNNPAHAKGLGESLEVFGTFRYGWLALAVVALGLAAYGAYQWIEAIFRRIRPA